MTKYYWLFAGYVCRPTSLRLKSQLFCVIIIMPPPVGKGAISVAFVRPSVRPQRIIREHKGLACPNLEGRFPVFDATSAPLSKSKGQRSKSPGPLMLPHILLHIFRTARPTNIELGTWMEDEDPHHSQAPWPPRSHVKVISRPINADTRRTPYLPKGKTYELETRRRHYLQGQRSRSQVLVISLSRLGQMLYLCH